MRREYYVTLLFMVVGSWSCNADLTPSFLSYFYNSNSAIIYSFNDSENTMIQKVDQLNANEVKLLSHMFNSPMKDEQDCRSEGMIVLYSNKKPTLKLRFSTDENCSNGSFLLKDELYRVKLTQSGKKYLKNLLVLSV